MGPSSLSRFSDLRGIVIAAIAIVVLVLGGAGGLMLYAASSLDRLQAEREAALIERRLQRMQEQLVEEVTSASIWNDAVQHVSAGDMEWAQVNFGDYYADYMDHELTLLFDGSGSLIYASRSSEPVAAADVAGFARVTAPLVAEVARQAAEPRRRAAFGFDAVATRSAIIDADGTLYLVAVSSVAPEDETVTRPARAAIVVSAQPVSAFLTSLVDELAIVAPKLMAPNAARVGDVSLSDASGRALGAVSWTPLRPGRGIVDQALPGLGAILVLLTACGVALFIRVDGIARRLAASEEALVDARDRAEAANEAKSRFLGQMSHELRTPLNGVMGMAEVLSIGPLTPLQQSHLGILKRSGADLLKMIENILLVTRLERSEAAIEAALPFDPRAVVEHIVAENRDRAAAKGLDLTVVNMLRGRRLGSGEDLGRMMGHLLDNALTFTESGGVRITARNDGDGISIAICDTGIGIEADILPRLFDHFVQADDSLSRRYDGAGLGLSICQGLVQAMNGQITVESVVGKGSTFTVTLPLPLATGECDTLKVAA